MNHLLKPCTGLWLSLRRHWVPGLVSSLLTLCFSPLGTCCSHPFFGLHSKSAAFSQPMSISYMSVVTEECVAILFCPHFHFAPLWSRLIYGEVLVTHHGQGRRVTWKVTPSFTHAFIHSSNNPRYAGCFLGAGDMVVSEAGRGVDQRGHPCL